MIWSSSLPALSDLVVLLVSTLVMSSVDGGLVLQEDAQQPGTPCAFDPSLNISGCFLFNSDGSPDKTMDPTRDATTVLPAYTICSLTSGGSDAESDAELICEAGQWKQLEPETPEAPKGGRTKRWTWSRKTKRGNYQRPARPRYARPRPAQRRPTRPRTARPRTARPRTARPRTARPRTARPQTARPQTARPRTVQHIRRSTVQRTRLSTAKPNQPSTVKPTRPSIFSRFNAPNFQLFNIPDIHLFQLPDIPPLINLAKPVACAAGSYSSDDKTCTLCAEGYYQEKVDMSACIQCPAGKSTNKAGATSANDCIESDDDGPEDETDSADVGPEHETDSADVGPEHETDSADVGTEHEPDSDDVGPEHETDSADVGPV
ncbi:unnamed protein product [Lymnaea stagnalis]|uniref:Tyrosine-protein kinase ephrin type A/B receptor-like domain-containing protein n=1 Tax=Lymnaea stagnalis TaxID=6523 RepID=A0AAV2I086_LYMST